MKQTDYNNIISVLLGKTNKRLDSLDYSIKEAESALAAEIAKSKELNVKRLQLMGQIESLRNSPKLAEDELGREFDKLFSIPDVIGVEIKDGKLLVYTSPISGDRGEFTMEFGLTHDQLRYVKFKGTDGSRFHHGHINSDGGPCLGNIRDQMESYMSQQQMFHAVVLGVEFLKS